ncbi:NUDIX hydrolase [Clostridiaceae bacterium M8S5]|nr:NUDIX hydrolase [Clostridiaceae bacterium M8S5]
MDNNIIKEHDTYLSNYASRFYVTCDTLVFTVQNEEGKENSNDLDDKKLKIALVKRENTPYKNEWALPGGFVKKEQETTYQAAMRKLYEEISLKDIYIEQLYTWDDVSRDPREHILSVSYMALVNSDEIKIKAGNHAKDARWFEVNKKFKQLNKSLTDYGYIKEEIYEIILTNKDIKIVGTIKEIITVKGSIKQKRTEVMKDENIAFDHIKIISYALERLKNKVDYTDIMFNLLPQYFTIAQAHSTYKLLTGKDYTNQNFRKKFKYKLIETDKKSKKYSPKPARLYKLNINWDQEQ